jgi:hypothetical protein
VPVAENVKPCHLVVPSSGRRSLSDAPNGATGSSVWGAATPVFTRSLVVDIDREIITLRFDC